MGKTFLASRVVDYFRQETSTVDPDGCGVGFFYCTDADANFRNGPAHLLRSLTLQLAMSCAQSETVIFALRDSLKQARISGTEPDLGTCTDWLLEAINSYPSTIFVLDGLDKLEPSAIASLVSTLEYLLTSTSKQLKLFLSSRENSALAPLRSPAWGVLFTIPLRHWTGESDGYGSHVWRDMEKILEKEFDAHSHVLSQLPAASEGS